MHIRIDSNVLVLNVKKPACLANPISVRSTTARIRRFSAQILWAFVVEDVNRFVYSVDGKRRGGEGKRVEERGGEVVPPPFGVKVTPIPCASVCIPSVNGRAAVGTEFLSAYPSHIHRKSPQDPNTNRTPKSFIPIPASCLFTERGLF